MAATAVHELPRAGPPALGEHARDDALLPLAAALRDRPGAFWLDSARPGAQLGRFSYAGADPYGVVRAYGAALEVECARAARPDVAVGRTRAEGDPLALLAPLLEPRSVRDDASRPPFVGGGVGWLGYELAAQLEPALVLRARDDLGLPDVALLLVDRLVALEHRSGRRFACALGFGETEADARRRAAAALDAWRAELDALERVEPEHAAPERSRCAAGGVRAEPSAGSSLDAHAYRAAVARLLDHIGEGDVYQACLTRRVEQPFAGDPWALYVALRAASPAPFAAWLSLPEATLLSTSPERFLEVRADGAVETRPIKGTRPRASDPARDRALGAELLASAKDRAENLMIVDLARHDLGRVCETGSVEVPELAVLESYANVHHLVSTVRGRLRPGLSALDAVRAAFPPGSMTGAPKLAAMRLLDRAEPVRRGPYAGALGWFDVRGGASLAVVIRTALLRGGRAYVHTGGGVVADSDPDAEWRESEDKVRPLLEALRAPAAADEAVARLAEHDPAESSRHPDAAAPG
ncbi:MAG TPA: aminodeoxychorismate synthase component I [Myxococcota bacterium]|nr:aminodeoxychorismate synthase component I [Myxococcota bacterium]